MVFKYSVLYIKMYHKICHLFKKFEITLFLNINFETTFTTKK